MSIITEIYNTLVGVVLRATSLFKSFSSNVANRLRVLVAGLTKGLDR